MDSILETIKKLLGITKDYEVFDTDIIVNINMALTTLFQLGIGTKPFVIKGYEESWDELVDNRDDIEDIKTYIFLKTKLVFDPPTTGIVTESYKEMIKELEFRISIKELESKISIKEEEK